MILDLHTVPGGGCPWGSCGRFGPNPNSFWGTDDHQDRVVEIWEAIATRFEGNPAVAGYDLINEPLLDYAEDSDDVAAKSEVYDRLYDAVRAIDADHVIFLNVFFGWDALAEPSEYGWTNVVLEPHKYEMPRARDRSAQADLVTDALAGVDGALADPGVPVLFGEYSLYYYDDVWAKMMSGLNARNVSWTNWNYKVTGDDAAGWGYWGFYHSNPSPVPVINSDDAASFVSRLERFGTANFERNDRFVATVSHYAGGLSTFSPTPLPMAGWQASASSTEWAGDPNAAIDGDPGSRWSSGIAQGPGQWFEVDMGAPTPIGWITMQTPLSDTWDYPRSFEIEVSLDGTEWTRVASGIGFGWTRPVTFETTTARYFRIGQAGITPEWWSIGELTVYAAAP